MKLDGNVLVDAPRQVVWKLLFDVDVLKQILNRIPGVAVEKLVQVTTDKYEATATIGVAMIKGKYDGVITVLDKRPPEYVKFHGEGKGGGNLMTGDMGLTLSDQDGKTLIQYEGAGNVNGPLATLGQRLVDMVGKQMIANGTQALGEELGTRAVGAAGSGQQTAGGEQSKVDSNPKAKSELLAKRKPEDDA